MGHARGAPLPAVLELATDSGQCSSTVKGHAGVFGPWLVTIFTHSLATAAHSSLGGAPRSGLLEQPPRRGLPGVHAWHAGVGTRRAVQSWRRPTRGAPRWSRCRRLDVAAGPHVCARHDVPRRMPATSGSAGRECELRDGRYWPEPAERGPKRTPIPSRATLSTTSSTSTLLMPWDRRFRARMLRRAACSLRAGNDWPATCGRRRPGRGQCLGVARRGHNSHLFLIDAVRPSRRASQTSLRVRS